jgi:hypothetical protein
MNQQIISFPKEGRPTLIANEWQVWDGERHEGSALTSIPSPEDGLYKVLVPFHWWCKNKPTHHQNGNLAGDLTTKIKKGEVGIWFAADDDILNHADLIEEGKKLWPVVAAHFPIFRDGRSFSTAALLRDRFDWQGEVRAIGDVLIDQLLQGARVGFDAFELRPDQNLDVALKQFELFSVTTQNSWRNQRATLAAA